MNKEISAAELLIIKYLEGNTSPEENNTILRWINESEENFKLFTHFKFLWESGKLSKHSIQDICDDEWRKISIQHFSFEKEKLQPNLRHLVIGILRISAIFIIAFGLSWFFLSKRDATIVDIPHSGFYEYSVPRGSRANLTLPDGSKIWLNAESKLKYSRNFNNEEREVYLEGEGFFDIVHLESESPFVVRTSGIDIQVLGTSFNVKCYSNEKTIETTLVKGSIELKVPEANRKTPGIKLKENQQATFARSSKKIAVKTLVEAEANTSGTTVEVQKKSSVNESGAKESTALYTAWKDDKLLFENETFRSLIIKFERWYGVNIELQNKGLEEVKFTGSFENETIEQALHALQFAYPFNFEMNKNNVRVY